MAEPPASPVAAEVEVFDPNVRTRQQWLATALVFACVTATFLALYASTATEAVPLTEVGVVMALVLGVVAARVHTWWRRRTLSRWRKATTTAQPGALDIRSAKKALSIRSRDLQGASTAVTDDGTYEWAISLRGQDRPILVRARTKDDLERLQKEIAFGQRDVHLLRWRIGAPAWQTGLAAFLFTFAGILAPLIYRFLGADLLSSSTFAVLSVSMFGSAFALRFAQPARAIALSDAGVHVQGSTLCGVRSNELGVYLPYSQITGLERVGSRLYVDLKEGHYAPEVQRALLVDLQDESVLSQAELAHIAAQISTAVRRARGEQEPAGTLDASLAPIERRGPTADWIGQLSSIEATREQGYRGLDLDRDALLRTATDPDIAPTARFAATRLLRRDPEARQRIELALEAARFEQEHEMLRIALDEDVDADRVDAALDAVTASAARYRSRP